MKMIQYQNKKGSHVGVMISFAIFVTFVVFLLVIFWPSLNVNNEKEAMVDNVEINFLNYLSTNLTTISIHIKNSRNLIQNCVELNQISALAETGLNGNNIAIKNAANSALAFELRETQNILAVASDKTNKFFKIYASGAIESSESTFSGCDSITANDYDVGLVRTEKKIFLTNISDAFSFYHTNYNILKQNLGVSSDEFAFDFIYENGTILSTGETPNGADISTKRISLDYLDTNLAAHVGDIVIKIW